MKTINFLLSFAVFTFVGSVLQPVPGQDFPVDSVRAEKVRVDTVVVEIANVEPWQKQAQVPPKQEEKSKGRNPKVYYGGYANFSVGQFTRIGFEPLIDYKVFPKSSVEAKLSYEYLKDERYETDYATEKVAIKSCPVSGSLVKDDIIKWR